MQRQFLNPYLGKMLEIKAGYKPSFRTIALRSIIIPFKIAMIALILMLFWNWTFIETNLLVLDYQMSLGLVTSFLLCVTLNELGKRRASLYEAVVF